MIGCTFCKHLRCTDNPPTLLQNFACNAVEERKIKNGGLCFLVENEDGLYEIVRNCPEFAWRERGVVLGAVPGNNT